MNEVIIQLKRVTKHYTEPSSGIKFQALKGVDLRLQRGKLYTIMGPSGAGKTTLAKIICGILTPSTGEIIVDELNIQYMNKSELDHFRVSNVGYLWQDPSANLFSKLSVRENIEMVLEIANCNREIFDTRVFQLLEIFDLSNKANQLVSSLSGGEAQRVALSVALANSPKILVLDEPTGELDEKTAKEMRQYLRRITIDLNLTTIVVTHDTNFSDISDQTLEIEDGVITNVKRRSVDPINNVEKEEEDISILDSNGRITLPNRILRKYKFGEFVELKETSEGVLIKRIEDQSKTVNNKEGSS